MATVNFIMQKKGGVGKSVTASLLYQALLEADRTVLGVDTDPSNKSLAGYKELKVTRLHILNDEEDVDRTLFDALIDSICELPEEAHVVIDNGSSNFVALRSYLKINGVPALLADMGHEVRIHAVIAGGPDLLYTCIGLKELATDFPDTGLVLWLNPYNGAIISDGKTFEELKVYQEHSGQFLSLVHIPKSCQSSMYRKDLQNHFASQITFQSAIRGSTLPVMTKQRLQIFWSEAKRAIELAGLL